MVSDMRHDSGRILDLTYLFNGDLVYTQSVKIDCNVGRRYSLRSVVLTYRCLLSNTIRPLSEFAGNAADLRLT